jgi:hypothetical protein
MAALLEVTTAFMGNVLFARESCYPLATRAYPRRNCRSCWSEATLIYFADGQLSEAPVEDMQMIDDFSQALEIALSSSDT